MADAQAMTEQLAEVHASELATTTAWPAISRAAHALDLEALRRELAAGVAVDLECTPGGRTPLQLVCGVDPGIVVYRRGGTHEAFVRWYLQPYVQRAEANNSVRADRVACVALLLEHGASPNPGGVHSPPLILTCSGYDPRNEKQECRECSCSLPIVNMLLAAGGDADARHRDGNYTFSPLLRCVIRTGWDNNDDVADALLKAGASANSPEFGGKTLMEWAIQRRHRRLWPVLLRGGANLPPPGENPFNWPGASYNTERADPYLQRIDAAGSWKAYEKAHRAALQAIFAPKFTHLVPPELVARIVEYSFHLGFY